MKKLFSIQEDPLSSQLEQISITPLQYGLITSNDITSSTYMHFHSRIIAVLEGNAVIHTNDADYSLSVHDALFLPSHTAYTWEANINWRCIVIDYDAGPAKFVKSLIEQYDLDKPHIFPGLFDDRQLHNLEHLTKTAESCHPGTYILVRSMIYRILIIAVIYQREHALQPIYARSKSRQEKILEKCIAYTEQHMKENFTVETMAEALHYSPGYLYKVFQNTMHMSCKEYILQYKLKYCLYELSNTKTSIQSIAQQYGFSSLYHFSATFKKIYGLSPTQYRANMQFKTK